MPHLETWALTHIARFRDVMSQERREEVLRDLSPKSQRIARVIFDPDTLASPGEREIGLGLRAWAR